MICDKCGEKLVVKSNPKYNSHNYEHEAHLIYVCENCDSSTKTTQMSLNMRDNER